jgi:hypothetical protein
VSKHDSVRGNVIALYTTAESWRGASISFVNIARGLARNGFNPHFIATSSEIAAELSRQGMRVSQLPSERSLQALRLRRRLVAIGATLVIVDRAHDLRVATRAVIGRRIGVINRYNLFRSGVPDDVLTRLAYRDIVKEVVFLSNAARENVLEAAPFMRSTPATTSEFREHADVRVAQNWRELHDVVDAVRVGSFPAQVAR